MAAGMVPCKALSPGHRIADAEMMAKSRGRSGTVPRLHVPLSFKTDAQPTR